MELLVSDQLIQGLYSAVFGLFFAFLYSLISAVRIVFSKRGSFLSYLFDFLYCLFVFILIFLFVNSYFGGVLRGFMVFVIAVSFLVSYIFVFKSLERFFVSVLTYFKSVMINCLRIVLAPVFRFFEILREKRAEISANLKKNRKKRSIHRKLLLKKGDRVVYNHSTQTKKLGNIRNGKAKKKTPKRKKHNL